MYVCDIKKLLLFLISIPLIFSSCEKDEEEITPNDLDPIEQNIGFYQDFGFFYKITNGGENMDSTKSNTRVSKHFTNGIFK